MEHLFENNILFVKRRELLKGQVQEGIVCNATRFDVRIVYQVKLKGAFLKSLRHFIVSCPLCSVQISLWVLERTKIVGFGTDALRLTCI